MTELLLFQLITVLSEYVDEYVGAGGEREDGYN